MRFLFVSNPATGQVNPLLAITRELLERGHSVHFASADRLAASFSNVALQAHASERAFFHGVGAGRALEDLTELIKGKPELFHKSIRHAPGQLAQYLSYVTTLDDEAAGHDEYARVVFKVRDLCLHVDADMIIVDNFSPFAMDGVRLSGKEYVQTSPAASCAAASFVDILRHPIGLSGADSGMRRADGSRSWLQALFLIWRNVAFACSFVYWCMTSAYAREKRRQRRDVLGLAPVDFLCDSYMTPAPHLVPQMQAALSFNVAGLDLYEPRCFDAKVFFVGPCFMPGTGPKSVVASFERPDAVSEWLDASEEVIYINMGSIFYFTHHEYEALIDALHAVRAQRPQLRALIKVPDLPKTTQNVPCASELPQWIRRESWIPSVENVLAHPAVRVAMHHGGGNSFNEAVAYGMPQLIVSQWGETHDIMAYGVHAGIALGSQCAPRLVAAELSGSMLRLLVENKAFRERALRWKLRSEQSGGTNAAVSILESYAARNTSASLAVRKAAPALYVEVAGLLTPPLSSASSAAGTPRELYGSRSGSPAGSPLRRPQLLLH